MSPVIGNTQAQLAEATDLSLEIIGRLERGVTAPSFETISALTRLPFGYPWLPYLARSLGTCRVSAGKSWLGYVIFWPDTRIVI